MNSFSLEEFCEYPERVFDAVARTENGVVIERGDQPNAVLMSLNTYNGIMETMYLLRSPANAAWLARGTEEMRRSAGMRREWTKD